MRLTSNILLLILLFLYCSSETDVEVYQPQNVLTDALTLEFTIGDSSNLKDEFIIAEPLGIMVNNRNEILIVDEGRVKVFSDEGKEKRIIGRHGEGPGEFGGFLNCCLSPEGYLTVLDAETITLASYLNYLNIVGRRFYYTSYLHNYYNLFLSDYSLVEKKRLANVLKLNKYFESKNINEKSIYGIRKLYFINETEIIYEILLEDNDPKSDTIYFTIILYEDENTVKPILHTKTLSNGRRSESRFFGKIHWALLPERRLMYINTLEDEHNEQIDPHYMIHVISIDTLEDTKFHMEFSPFLIPKEEKEKFIKMQESISGITREHAALFRESASSSIMKAVKSIRIMKDRKYYPSIDRLRIDRNFAFVFTVDRSNTTRITKENILTSVIDLNTGELTSNVKLPIVPQVIMNGYAYFIGEDDVGFPQIEKYKIDPAVYGK